MTAVVDDPLISRMTISRRLPLHESSRRLRDLYPECPRVYGVAVIGDLTRRRWWPLEEALTTDRLRVMFDAAAAETDSRMAVAQQLAATLSHVVIGRVIPLLSLEGRAWDTGLENLWVHVDSEGAIDWVGVSDPTLRVLQEDPYFDGHPGGHSGMRRRHPSRDRIVALPSEAALATWVAHRSHRALQPLFERLHDISAAAMTVSAMWHTVGSAVVGAATQVPLLAGSSELTSMRRAQAVLDALVGFGAPVRGQSRIGRSKVLLN
jgi:hypothetical protein